MRRNPSARVRKNANTHILSFVLLLLFTLILGYHAITLFRPNDVKSFSFTSHFSLDLRSLAIGRICLGLLIITDVITSKWHLRQFFLTDQGFWPRNIVLLGGDPQIQKDDFSIYLGFGSMFWASFSLIMVSISGICVVLGHWTQTNLFVCWLHTYSLTYRCSGIQQAGDTLLRLILFWSIFLPCGVRYSLDSMLQTTSNNDSHNYSNSNTVTSLAALAILIQMSMLYIFPAVFKTVAAWKNGTAISYVLKNFAFVSNNKITQLLLSNKRYTSMLTYVTPILEHSAPLMLLFRPFRCVGVVFFVGFHLGLKMTMRLGLFPFVCITGWIMVMPSECWNIFQHVNEDSMNGGVYENEQKFSFVMNGMVWCMKSVVTILLISIQGTALYLSIACNVNTLPLIPKDNDKNKDANSNVSNVDDDGANSNVTVTDFIMKILNDISRSIIIIFSMNDDKYYWSRKLGVQQQWFLFDNPPKRSFWFRIVGEDVQGNQYDLHKMTLLYSQPPTITSTINWIKSYTTTAAAAAAPSSESSFTMFNRKNLIYTRTLDEEYETMSFEEIYGNHRWRKFFQKLNAPTKLFNQFHQPYANSLNQIWKIIGMENKCGKLKKVKCIKCAIPLEETIEMERSGGEMAKEGECIKIQRGTAWEVKIEVEKTKKN